MNKIEQQMDTHTHMSPDKSLTKVFKELEGWMAHAEKAGDLAHYVDKLRNGLAASGPLRKSASLQLDWLGMYYGNAACVAFGQQQVAAMAQPFRWAVAYRSLGFRFGAIDPPLAMQPVQLPPFKTSLKAVGPVMLSQWDEAAINAHLLVAYAEAEQARNAFPGSEREKGWGKGTHDAFVIGLLAQAFNLTSTYEPEAPMISAYQGLLDRWRTTDEAVFRQAMAPAIAFHLDRSKPSTKKVEYEFDSFMDTVFPAELLAVQALRRRDGLPLFDTGHALVDAPWAILQGLPAEANSPPLLVETEARLKADYPNFR